MLKNIYNLTSIFHGAIIAMFLLSLNGCGYKAAPFYENQKVITKDKNVVFIQKSSESKKID